MHAPCREVVDDQLYQDLTVIESMSCCDHKRSDVMPRVTTVERQRTVTAMVKLIISRNAGPCPGGF